MRRAKTEIRKARQTSIHIGGSFERRAVNRGIDPEGATGRCARRGTSEAGAEDEVASSKNGLLDIEGKVDKSGGLVSSRSAELAMTVSSERRLIISSGTIPLVATAGDGSGTPFASSGINSWFAIPQLGHVQFLDLARS